MGNIVTEKAITTNIESILTSSPLDLVLHDLSADPKGIVKPAAMLLYEGGEAADNFGEAPTYIESAYTVKIGVNNSDPADRRALEQEIVHKLRAAFADASTLNIGDLSSSKLVTRITHGEWEVDREPPVSFVTYPLTIRWRES